MYYTISELEDLLRKNPSLKINKNSAADLEKLRQKDLTASSELREIRQMIKRDPSLAQNPNILYRLNELNRLVAEHSKHGNVRVDLDGYTFDSQFEAERYGELRWALQVKAIKGFIVHKKYDIGGGRTYEADFEVEHLDGSFEAEDTKGHETDVFRLKAALFREKYPEIKFTIIKREESHNGKRTRRPEKAQGTKDPSQLHRRRRSKGGSSPAHQ
jgi:hypothetical protein